MQREFPESDWKVLRQLHRIALERFCERILGELERLIADPGKSAHERYLAIYQRIHERDDEMAFAFDDMRRSRAFLRIAGIRSLGLLTEEELDRFSPETRDRLRPTADQS